MQRLTSILVRLPIVALLALAPMVGTGCGDDTVTTDVKSITVAPPSATIAVGGTQKFVCTGILSNGTTKDLTGEVTWSSSDTAVATITGGTATGVKVGTVTITAKTSAGLTATAELTVKEKKLISVAITPPSATIASNTTQQFTATANYDDGTNEDVTQSADAKWTSSDDTIATVDKGLAKGLKNGTVDISVEFKTLKDSARLTVGSKPKTINVTPANEKVAKGSKVQYKAIAVLEDNSQQDVTTQATWASSSAAVATIDANGEATAVGIGTTKISATLGTIKGETDLTVTDKVVTKVEVTPNPVPNALQIGGKQKFVATAVFNDNSTQDVTATATWASSVTTVATIDATGEATAVGNGATQITAEYQSVKSLPVTLTVASGLAVKSIAVTPATASIAVGITQQYTAVATMSDNTTQNITSAANWQSSTVSVASIDAAGLATAKAIGTTTITATWQGVSGTAQLTVTDKIVTGLSVTPSSAQTIPNGGTITFTCTATYSDKTTQDVSAQATWSSTPTGIVSFTGNVAKGTAIGATKVACALPSAPGVNSNQVDVTVTAATLVSIAITNPPTSPIPVGATYAFNAEGTYSDGTKQPVTTTALWTSGTPATATISNAAGTQGVATAVAAGTTQITAKIGSITSPAVTLTVATGVTLAYITITPDTATVNVGQAQQFKAVGTYSDGSTFDITTTATWLAVCHTGTSTISNFTVDKGLVTGVSSTNALNCGSATANYGRVMAKFGTIQSFAKVTVKNTTITSIAVACPAPRTCLPSNLGYKTACTATATFADGTTGDITSTASWGSTATSVATAAAGGIVTIVGVGQTAITATQGGQTSSSTVGSNVWTLQGAALNWEVQGGVSALWLSPMVASVNKGFTVQYQAIGYFTSTTPGCTGVTIVHDLTDEVTWGSANTNVATVSNAAATKGLATALAAGSTSITAVYGTHTSPLGALNVTDACLDKVVIDNKNPTYPGQVYVQLSVKGYYSDAPNTPVQLKPSDFTAPPFSVPGCAGYAIDPATWMLKVGTATCNGIQFGTNQGTCGGATKSDTTNVTVDTAAVLNSLAIEPATAKIVKGAAQDFVATATFAGYPPFNVAGYAAWSNNPAVAGLTHAPAVAPAAKLPAERFAHVGTVGGTTVVSATYGSKTATANLEITGSTISKVEIDSLGAAPCTTGGGFPVGIKLPVTVKVTYSDGTVEFPTTGVTLTSSDPNKLSVAGLVATTAAPSAGTDPTLTASYQGVSSTTATVVSIRAVTGGSAVVLTNMTFSEAQGATLPQNTTKALTITGVYSNCGNFDISALVTSASSNSTIVDVATSATGTVIMTKSTPTGGTPVTLSFIKDGLTRTLGINVAANACLSSVAVTPASVTINQGLSQAFVATATDTLGAQTVVTGLGTWASSDTTVLNNPGGTATFTASNTKTGNATVTFTLTAGNVCKGGNPTQNTITGSAAATVNAATIASVAIIGGAGGWRYIPIGEAFPLEAWATYTNGDTADITSAPGTVWATLNSSIATITGGVLVGVAAGQTSISVTSANGKTAVLNVYVAACALPTVTITSTGSGLLPKGETRDYEATAAYTETGCGGPGPVGPWLLNELVYDCTTRSTWNSSVTTVATITSQGRATAVNDGTTNISATYKTVTSNLIPLQVVSVTLKTLTVTPSPTVTVFKGAGGAVPITVSAVWGDASCVAPYNDPTHCFNLAPPVVSWAITNGSLISITGPKAGTGNSEYTLTGLDAGSTTFFAQVNTIISNTVTANVTPACITGITLTAPAGDVVWPAGVPFTLAYTCTTSDGTPLACNPGFSVSGANPAIIQDYLGSYGTSGKARIAANATAGQNANVIATVTVANGACGSNKTSTRKITVGDATLASIALPSSTQMAKGTQKTVQATGTFTGTTGAGQYDITDAAIYASTNTTVVTTQAPNPGGVLTALQVDGTSVVTASYLGKTSNNCTVAVSGRVLTGIAISAELNCTTSTGGSCPGTGASYPAGGFQLQLKATGTYSSGPSEDITSQVAWSLDTPVVSGTSISTGGLLTTGNPTATQVQTVRAKLSPAPDATFTVSIIPGAVTTIAIRRPSASAPFWTALDPAGEKVAKGITQPYLSLVTILGGYTFFATKNVTWASSVPTVGTVVASGDKAGEFKAAELGTTNISANKGAISSGPVAVTVTAAVPQSVYCKPTNVNLVPGGTAQLRAWVKLSDGNENEITTDNTWTWTSTNTSIAQFASPVSDPGLVTAGTAGTAYAYPTKAGIPIPPQADQCKIVVQ